MKNIFKEVLVLADPSCSRVANDSFGLDPRLLIAASFIVVLGIACLFFRKHIRNLWNTQAQRPIVRSPEPNGKQTQLPAEVEGILESLKDQIPEGVDAIDLRAKVTFSLDKLRKIVLSQARTDLELQLSSLTVFSRIRNCFFYSPLYDPLFLRDCLRLISDVEKILVMFRSEEQYLWLQDVLPTRKPFGLYPSDRPKSDALRQKRFIELSTECADRRAKEEAQLDLAYTIDEGAFVAMTGILFKDDRNMGLMLNQLLSFASHFKQFRVSASVNFGSTLNAESGSLDSSFTSAIGASALMFQDLSSVFRIAEDFEDSPVDLGIPDYQLATVADFYERRFQALRGSAVCPSLGGKPVFNTISGSARFTLSDFVLSLKDHRERYFHNCENLKNSISGSTEETTFKENVNLEVVTCIEVKRALLQCSYRVAPFTHLESGQALSSYRRIAHEASAERMGLAEDGKLTASGCVFSEDEEKFLSSEFRMLSPSEGLEPDIISEIAQLKEIIGSILKELF